MGILSFRPERPGNVREGGNTRAPGEEEPDVLEAQGLSEPEIAEHERTAALNRQEIGILENALHKLHLRAADALQNTEDMNALSKAVNPGTRTNVRFFKFKDHLEELARRDRAKRFAK